MVGVLLEPDLDLDEVVLGGSIAGGERLHRACGGQARPGVRRAAARPAARGGRAAAGRGARTAAGRGTRAAAGRTPCGGQAGGSRRGSRGAAAARSWPWSLLWSI